MSLPMVVGFVKYSFRPPSHLAENTWAIFAVASNWRIALWILANLLQQVVGRALGWALAIWVGNWLVESAPQSPGVSGMLSELVGFSLMATGLFALGALAWHCVRFVDLWTFVQHRARKSDTYKNFLDTIGGYLGDRTASAERED